jgi:hypothetical protein
LRALEAVAEFRRKPRMSVASTPAAVVQVLDALRHG